MSFCILKGPANAWEFKQHIFANLALCWKYAFLSRQGFASQLVKLVCKRVEEKWAITPVVHIGEDWGLVNIAEHCWTLVNSCAYWWAANNLIVWTNLIKSGEILHHLISVSLRARQQRISKLFPPSRLFSTRGVGHMDGIQISGIKALGWKIKIKIEIKCPRRS